MIVWSLVWFGTFTSSSSPFQFSEDPTQDGRIRNEEADYIVRSIGPVNRVKVPMDPLLFFVFFFSATFAWLPFDDKVKVTEHGDFSRLLCVGRRHSLESNQ